MERALPRGSAKWSNRRRRLYCILFIVGASFVLGQFAVLNFTLLLTSSYPDFQQQLTQSDVRLHERNAQPDEDDDIRRSERVLMEEEDLADDVQATKKPQPTRLGVNSFISPYHKHWDVNCSAILAGDRQVVRETSRMLKKLRDDKDTLPMPSDNEVDQWVTNCSDYRQTRHYPDVALSGEEEDYPLAYIIVIHKEIAQVERLLRSIYQPQNVYCIHPDSKSPDSFQTAIRKLVSCFDNVFIVSVIESVQYAGFTRLKADINCMADLNRHPVKWKYVMNLCGQDFPLKTNLEMVHQLKAYNGHNDINGIIPPPYIAPRTKFHHKMNGKRPMRTKRLKSPPPYDLTIYFGNAYYAATWQFVDFVVNDKVAIDLLEWSNDTWSPDEHFWVTLQRSVYAPGGFPNATWEENIRFMKWGDVKRHPACQGKYVRALCVFGVGYLEYLHKQPYLFANKFYYSYDPIALQCMEEILDHRTWNPEESSKLVNFPMKDMSWQNYSRPAADKVKTILEYPPVALKQDLVNTIKPIKQVLGDHEPDDTENHEPGSHELRDSPNWMRQPEGKEHVPEIQGHFDIQKDGPDIQKDGPDIQGGQSDIHEARPVDQDHDRQLDTLGRQPDDSQERNPENEKRLPDYQVSIRDQDLSVDQDSGYNSMAQIADSDEHEEPDKVEIHLPAPAVEAVKEGFLLVKV